MCAIHAGHGTHTITLKFIYLTSDLLPIWPSHKKKTLQLILIHYIVYFIPFHSRPS